MKQKLNGMRLIQSLLSALILVSLCLPNFVVGQMAMQPEPIYQGYRLHLANIDLLKRNDRQLEIKCMVINTGRKEVKLGETQSFEGLMQWQFDESLEANALQDFRKEITATLLKQKKALAAGSIWKDVVLKVSIKDKETPKPKDNAKQKIKEEEIVAVEEVKEVEEIEADLEEKEIETSSEEEIAKVVEEVEEIKEDLVVKGEEMEADDDDARCADLVLESIKVLRKNNRWANIEYTIRNQGRKAAAIRGKSKSDKDNITLRISMCSNEKLNKGAAMIGGAFVTSSDKDPKLKLQPNETLTTRLRVDISHVSKYFPYLIFELDADNQIQECDETNNRNSIQVK